MEARREALIGRAAKTATTALVAYAASAMVAATALGFVLDFPDLSLAFTLAPMVGLLALPFVFVTKCTMIANHWDGVWHHAAAGLLVGATAGILIAEARDPRNIGVFAVAGMSGSMSYLGARNLARRVVRW